MNEYLPAFPALFEMMATHLCVMLFFSCLQFSLWMRKVETNWFIFRE